MFKIWPLYSSNFQSVLKLNLDKSRANMIKLIETQAYYETTATTVSNNYFNNIELNQPLMFHNDFIKLELILTANS